MRQRCKICKKVFDPKKAEICVPGTIFCPFCDEEIPDKRIEIKKNK